MTDSNTFLEIFEKLWDLNVLTVNSKLEDELSTRISVLKVLHKLDAVLKPIDDCI